MSIRVAIVDDHPMVTGGLAAALGTIDDVAVVARGATVGEARELLARDDIDVVLMDVRLEDGNGIQALAERAASAAPRVLVMSSFKTKQHVAASAKYGASGFLLKTVPLPTLVEAIRTVHAGGSVFADLQPERGFVTLSRREREIVELAALGMSNKEIGAKLDIAAKTVETRLGEIYERFGITGGRVELSLRARDEGWLDFEPPAARG